MPDTLVIEVREEGTARPAGMPPPPPAPPSPPRPTVLVPPPATSFVPPVPPAGPPTVPPPAPAPAPARPPAPLPPGAATPAPGQMQQVAGLLGQIPGAGRLGGVLGGIGGAQAAAGAGAAGAAGGLAGAAAVAGPIGAAVVAGVELVKQVDAMQREMARNLARSIGEPLRALASLSLEPLNEKFHELLTSTGYLGEGYSALVRQLGAFGTALEGTSRRLSQYSAPLSQAEAMRETNQILGDVRRAQLLGPDLAKFIDAQSRIEQSRQDILAGLLRPILPLVAAATNDVAELTDKVLTFLKKIRPDWFGPDADVTPLDEILQSGRGGGQPLPPFLRPPVRGV